MASDCFRSVCRWSLVLAAATYAASSLAQTTPVQFSAPPYLKPAELAANLEPLREQLEIFFDRKVVFSPREDYPAFRASLSGDEFDVVVLSAFDYLHSQREERYIPVARLLGYQIINIVSILPDVSSTRDLRGKRVGFASASSPTTIIGKILLSDAALASNHYDAVNLPTQDVCLQRMLDGVVDACVTYQRPANNFFVQHKVRYRVLARSSIVPQAVVVIRRSLVEWKEPLAKFLCELNEEREFKLTLGSGFPMDFIEVDDSDFEAIGEIYKKNSSLFK